MRFIFTFVIILIWHCSEESLAAISVGVSGANSTSSFSLETHKSTTISGNIAVGIARFMRIGFTHRRSNEQKSGLKKQTSTDQTQIIYYEFEDNTDIITNSIDLTIILHQGLVSPFIFGGVARRDYFTEVKYPGSTSKGSTTLPAVPNYGFGISFMLSRQFNLKITQTFTPGLRTELIDGEEVDKDVKDSYTQIGIGYKL